MRKEFNQLYSNKIVIYINNVVGAYSDRSLFIVFSFIGIVSSSVFRPELKALSFQFGIEAIGLFVPPFLTCTYFAIVGLRNKFQNKILLEALLLFVIQLIPIFDLLFYIISPNPGEDFSRNLAYARNMIDNCTLWGGDQIAYPYESKAFITQPGYRYFLTFEMLLFKNLYRFVSVVNIFFFIATMFLFMKSIVISVEKSIFRAILIFFMLLTVPYATKNILMGLSEWLMVCLLMLSVYFFKVKNNSLLTLIVLGLVIFVRQNTLPSVLVMAAFVIFSAKNRIMLLLSFLIVLFLPLYHNLYYAGEWRFFASIHQWPFFKYDSPSKYSDANGVNYLNVLNNVLHYLGIHIRNNGTIDFLEEAFLFLFAFPGIIFYIQRHFFDGQMRLIFLLSSFLIIGPTILIATHFYPRFEFVCVYFSIVLFLFLYQQKSRFLEESNHYKEALQY